VAGGIADLGWGWQASSLALLLVYYYSHYFFASNVAHVSAMFSAFLVCMIATGAPPVLASLVLAFLSNTMGGLGTWTMSHAPMFFGEGCVPCVLRCIMRPFISLRAHFCTALCE
jgi:divalent anion:Na+ symporter, DASS family